MINKEHWQKLRAERKAVDDELQSHIVHKHARTGLCVVKIGFGFGTRYYVMREGNRGHLIPESDPFILRKLAIEKLMQLAGEPCGQT